MALSEREVSQVATLPGFQRPVEDKIFILPKSESFAIRRPVFFINEAISVVLLPGDAHKSKILSFGFGSNTITGSMLEISCT